MLSLIEHNKNSLLKLSQQRHQIEKPVELNQIMAQSNVGNQIGGFFFSKLERYLFASFSEAFV